jgi:gamma-glutamyltranspeptidase/glutathione hydrolase
MRLRALAAGLAALAVVTLAAESTPIRTKSGMVVSQNETASRIGAEVLRDGGSVIDAAVATSFALAVTHPTAGNIGGGGFIVFRPASGEPVAYDFREMAPAKASPTMFLKDGKYSSQVHHDSYLAVGVPGTVAGLHLAWQKHGKLPWKRLVNPAIALARDGFIVTDGLSRSLKSVLPQMKGFPASIAQFTKGGVPYEAGDLLKLPDLARALQRIADKGPAGFYEGETALLIEKDMAAHGGLITRDDLKAYQPEIRTPLRGTYRDLEVISIPPPSSGGTALIEMLNILEAYDLKSMGFGSAASLHLIAESMRRGFADRARYLGDPDFNPSMPIARLTSKAYAADLRRTIQKDHASKSSPMSFEWPGESDETTHISIVDRDRNAVAMTFTLEDGYGVKAVVAGAGFLLNNEMGDFNAGPSLTTAEGLVGTEPNLAGPHKRMLSSMTPTILTRNGKLFMVTGSPGGRSIINTVLLTILNVVDFGMNAQGAVDAARIHHQWLPDRIQYERNGLSPDTVALLTAMGHTMNVIGSQGVTQVIVVNQKEDVLEGGCDRRAPDGGAVAQPVK